MADNNKNPRRTIWLSETEPLSHYDIWLSKNQHLNSDGEPLSDTGVLRPCDYIFKVWDCGDWHPIVGLNSTALNKINTVLNTGYTTTHDGHSINSSSYLEFHLPLFTSPNSSPLELFDAGTIGEAILEYVTELEWKNIFEGDAFNKSFEWYFKKIINEGSTNIINELLDPADHEYLGGIWADEFSIEDMFPDTEENHYYTSSQINDSYNWIALAKYKLNHGTSDYNLYVNAKDIIKIITEYQEDNPDEPGITPGGGATIDPEVIYRSFYNSPTVLKGWRDDNPNLAWKPRFEIAGARILQNRGRFLKIRNDDWWQTNVDPYSDENNAIEWVDLNDYIVSAINDNELLVGGNGVIVSYNAPHGDNPQYISLGLAHIQQAIDGAICRKITSNDLSDIEWTLLDDIYPLLTADSSSDIRYVVKGGSNDKHYLNGNGEWTVPTGLDYWGDRFINVDRTEAKIMLAPIRETGSFYIDCTNGTLNWKRVKSGEYPTLSSNDHNAGTSYVINGCNKSSAAKFFLNGEGEWIERSEGGDYSGGIGINIDLSNNININIPDGTTEGLVLSYDGHGDVEWITVLSGGTEEYDAGDGIEILTPLLGNKIIKGNIKECDLNGYNSGFSADTSIEFRAPSGSSIIKNVVTLNIDGGNLYGGSTYDLLPYTYTKINLAFNGTINFVIDGQTSYVNGNPIYVILSIPDKTYSTYTINIKDSLNNNSNDFISINNALVSDSSSIKFGCDVNKFLITMLFGIVKVEPLGYIESNGTEPEPEPSES